MNMNINLSQKNRKIESFTINGSKLEYNIKNFPLLVNSFPKKYEVNILDKLKDYKKYLEDADFIIIDKQVNNLYSVPKHSKATIYSIDATEDNKNLNTVTDLINIFIEKNISKGSKVVAIGGGIIQDISACACALFRRGLPFIYMPTTTLGQLDSCIGAKCAVNTPLAKNILGLFSAPKEVIIPTFTVQTMPLLEHRAGLSEMLRLCITASEKAIRIYLDLFPHISNPSDVDLSKYSTALKTSLSIKKSVVDFDEYETDVRRSMNYGHTFGHAIEKLTSFKIPHGLAVLLGIHVANKFSNKEGYLNSDIYEILSLAIKTTLFNVNADFSFLKNINAEEVVNQFKYDKKGDGKSVPLIIIKNPGDMIFYRYFFNTKKNSLIDAIDSGIIEFIQWSRK